MTLLVDRN